MDEGRETVCVFRGRERGVHRGREGRDGMTVTETGAKVGKRKRERCVFAGLDSVIKMCVCIFRMCLCVQNMFKSYVCCCSG